MNPRSIAPGTTIVRLGFQGYLHVIRAIGNFDQDHPDAVLGIAAKLGLFHGGRLPNLGRDNPPGVAPVVALKRVGTGARTPPGVDGSPGKCTPKIGISFRLFLEVSLRA
jgi:hypothetical protein